MSLMVLKFGGTLIGDINTIYNQDGLNKIAKIIQQEKNQGHQIVVVISAMAGNSRLLKNLSNKLALDGDKREEDVILAAGEQITAGLLAKLLSSSKFGLKARSLLAWQIPIITDENHGNAAICRIDPDKIKQYLQEDYIVVIPGFQGLTKKGDLTTLGFDGSDTTAAALAGVLQAHCRIYKDVSGVYTANPSRVPTAQKLAKISYQQMYVLATLGARILHPNAVKTAEQYGLELHLCQYCLKHNTGKTIITKKVAAYPIAGITYYCHAPSAYYISVIGTGLTTDDQTKIIAALKRKKIMAEPVKTAFTENAITVKINWSDQLDICLQTLHSLFGLDKTIK